MRDVLRELDRDCCGSGDVDGCPIIEALSDVMPGVAIDRRQEAMS
jgi:hypothetical protein